MDKYKPFHRSTPYKPTPKNQEEWIKENVKESAQTQCVKCGKWISKYWHRDTDINYVMTKCGRCYADEK